MKKMLLILLFISGVTNSQSKLTYEDFLKERALYQRFMQIPQIKKQDDATTELCRAEKLLNEEYERCLIAKDCETSEIFLTRYVEYIKAGLARMAAAEEVKKSLERRELKKVHRELESKLNT